MPGSRILNVIHIAVATDWVYAMRLATKLSSLTAQVDPLVIRAVVDRLPELHLLPDLIIRWQETRRAIVPSCPATA